MDTRLAETNDFKEELEINKFSNFEKEIFWELWDLDPDYARETLAYILEECDEKEAVLEQARDDISRDLFLTEPKGDILK